VPNESAKPYRAYDQACTWAPKKHYASYWGQLYPGRFATRDEIKAYINYYGSVVTYMKADYWFSWYRSGIYNSSANTNYWDVNHAVTIVGWCDQYNSWIIKNSYGTSWGYSGYAYVDYNTANIGKYIYYVMPRPSAGWISTSAPITEAPVQPGNNQEKETAIVTEKSPIIEASKE
jgi:C1A family cysteine protease